MPHLLSSARFAQDESGTSLAEYALTFALITVVCIAAVSVIGSKLSSLFSSASSSL